jgi:hypothetical protein
MKQTAFVLLLLACAFSAVSGADIGTAAIQAAPPAITKTAVQADGGVNPLPLTGQPNSGTLAEQPAETPPAYQADNTFPVQQKCLLAGDILSVTFCAVQWANFLQDLSDYNEAYNRYNNTTYANYQMLLGSRNGVLNSQRTAWISTGAAAALLFYTAADIIWIHAVFPVAPGLAYWNNIQVLTLSCKF